jgi:hypothetical protein
MSTGDDDIAQDHSDAAVVKPRDETTAVPDDTNDDEAIQSQADEPPIQAGTARAARRYRPPAICFENFLETYARAPEALEDARRMLRTFEESPEAKAWLSWVEQILQVARSGDRR